MASKSTSINETFFRFRKIDYGIAPKDVRCTDLEKRYFAIKNPSLFNEKHFLYR
jgi:hypothetical protein